MSKMKKFLAAILSAATVFSMSALPAFADTTTPVTGLTFTKTYLSENGASLPNAEFTFTMTPATVESGTKYNGVEVVSGLELKESEKKIPFTSATADEDAAKAGIQKSETFDLTPESGTFTGPKAYSYTVKEVVPTTNKDNSIDYDTTEYTVYVIVDNDNTITAVVNISSKKGDDATSVDKPVAKKPIEFTNTCSTDSLVIKKVVTGSMGNKTTPFTFQMLIPVNGIDTGHTIAEGTTYTGKIYRKATNTATETVTFTVKDNLGDSENIFTLADGDYLTIEDLPEYTIYSVTEQGAADYQTSIVGTTSTGSDEKKHTVDSGKTYDAKTANTPIVNGGNTIVFTNNKDITTTGLILKVGPQLLVLLIAVGGALVIFKTRKRNKVR